VGVAGRYRGAVTARRRSRAAAGKPPVTAEDVVAAAVVLTREHGLDGWTIRGLATRLDVWPAVVAHHVGDREAVVEAVTDRVVGEVPVPADDLPWRDWFTALSVGGRRVLRGYRGVARRLTVVGPTVPSALPTIDAGIGVLLRDGFGPHAAPVYRYLLNSAFMLVAVEDERTAFPTARATMGAAMGRFGGDGDRPGLAAAAVEAARWRTDPAGLAEQDEAFFRFTLERALDGAAALLDTGQ
jgi:AcrR family transcriptional regulator